MKLLKMIILGLLCILGALLVLHHIFPNKKSPRSLVTNIYSIYFSGKVNFIDASHGLKVGVENSSVYYDLSGAYNDTSVFSENVTWGDIISKHANTDTIMLKSKSNGKLSLWKLSTKNKSN